MKKFIIYLFGSLIILSSNIVNAADKVVFGTNWLAQGGHGGFYQAIADGTYKKHGLDVEIMMGGPQMNNRPMLIAGKLDFLMTGIFFFLLTMFATEYQQWLWLLFFKKILKQ